MLGQSLMHMAYSSLSGAEQLVQVVGVPAQVRQVEAQPTQVLLVASGTRLLLQAATHSLSCRKNPLAHEVQLVVVPWQVEQWRKQSVHVAFREI